MGDLPIALINEERDPPCVSDAGNNHSTNSKSKGGETAGRQKDGPSSFGIVAAVVGTLVFLMMIFVVALLILR